MTCKSFIKKTNIITLSLSILLLTPILAWGAEPPISLVELPRADTSGSFNNFVNTLYYLSIGIAGLLAVIKIIIAGVKYMLSDIVTDKSDAKSDIKGALLGLLIVLGAVLILGIINPQLTQVNFNPERLEEVPASTPTAESLNISKEGDTRLSPANITLQALKLAPDNFNYSEKYKWACETKNPELCINKTRSQMTPAEVSAGKSNFFCYKGEWKNDAACVVNSGN